MWCWPPKLPGVEATSMTKKQNLRFKAALWLHLLLVGGLLMHVLLEGFNGFALQWVRFEQQEMLRNLPGDSPLIQVTQLSEPEFQQLALIGNNECIIDDQYFEIVSVVWQQYNVVLRLLPDHKETSLSKRIAIKKASDKHFRRRQQFSLAGFVFFETQTPVFSCMEGCHHIAPEVCPNPFCSPVLRIDKPPPRLFTPA